MCCVLPAFLSAGASAMRGWCEPILVVGLTYIGRLTDQYRSLSLSVEIGG